MALEKRPVNINFGQGVETKTDPNQVPIGKFAALMNAVFDEVGAMTKRNGFGNLTQLPNATQTTLTTFNNNLIATGSNLYAYSADTNQTLNKGVIQPIQLSVTPLVRNSAAQTVCDSAVAPSGLACLVYTENSLNYYQVIDSATGQQIVGRVALPSTATNPRVVLFSTYFLISFAYTNSGVPNLAYIAVPVNNPTNPTAVTQLTSVLSSIAAPYATVVMFNTLYLAFNASDGSIKLLYMGTDFVKSAATSISSTQASLISLSADLVNSRIWLNWWYASSTNGFTQAYFPNLSGAVFGSPVQTITGVASINTLTAAAASGTMILLYEVNNTYASPYPVAGVKTDYLAKVTVLQSSGAVTQNGIILRSAGLASKAFVAANGNTYVLAAYGEQNQPTYFLIDSTGAIYMRLAYANGGGYASTFVLPNVSSLNNTYYVPYLVKDFLATTTNVGATSASNVNKTTNLPTGSPVNSIYTQTGVNMAKFTINAAGQYSAEIASALHLTGGQLWMYDGVKPVEHGFHVWPENIASATALTGGALAPQQYYYQFCYEWTDNQGNLHRSAPSIPQSVKQVVPTAPVFQGAFQATFATFPVSSTAGLFVGQIVTDVTTPSAIAPGTKITAIGSGTITVSPTPAVNSGPQTTSVFTSGTTNLTVASTTGLVIGQSIVDITTPGNFAANTTITNISGSVITLSSPTLGSSASTPGDTVQVEAQMTAITAVSTNSVFAAGATSITVASATGLAVGQYLTDSTTSGNIQALTYITSISGTTIGLSLPTAGASASSPGDVIQTIDLGVNTLYVPTLRLTYKVSPNSVRIVGYRWSTAQQTYYQFTNITSPILNDPTIDFVTITDSKADIQILGQTLLYTTGGVVEDIAAPASTASALFQNRLFLVDAEDPNLLWFSKQVIEAVPIEMSDLLTIYVAPTSGAQGSTGPVTALSAMDDKLIIFKKNAIYYITGAGPDNTGANNGFSDPIYITSSVGCANPNSIVLTPNGIMFQSDKGIWLLARDLSTKYIGAPVEEYNSLTVSSATAIPGTNQIRFILPNNMMLMYDYYVDQWGTFTSIQAISATLFNGKHTYLTSTGAVLQETAGVYLDASTPVLMSFVTAWINIAGLQGYERFYFMYLLGTYFTPFKLNVKLAYDYNSSQTQSVVVTPDNYSPAWGVDPVWGSSPNWGGQANVFTARIFPQVQKCSSFQISINETYDPSSGTPAGEGLSLSGLNLVVGAKKGYRTQKAGRSFG